MHPENLEAIELFGLRHVFKVCTVACYIGGYIRDKEYKHYWLKNRMDMWEQNIGMIRETTGEYLKKVTPQWYAQTNLSGYFYNVSQIIQETHFWEWWR